VHKPTAEELDAVQNQALFEGDILGIDPHTPLSMAASGGEEVEDLGEEVSKKNMIENNNKNNINNIKN
jgi:hypothetical protein